MRAQVPIDLMPRALGKKILLLSKRLATRSATRDTALIHARTTTAVDVIFSFREMTTLYLLLDQHARTAVVGVGIIWKYLVYQWL